MHPPVPPAVEPRLRTTPIAIAGLPLDPVTMEEAVTWIAEAVASGRPHYGVTANVDFVVQALGDAELRRIIFDAHLVLCDGMPIVWASRLLGNPLPERVAGSDLMPRLLIEAERQGWRVFFLGGTPETVRLAAERSRARHPRLILAGAHSPPYQHLLEMDHAELAERIREAKPDLLFVSFGCPKQEKWINLHYRRMGVPFCLGIGAALDFLAGTVRRAPRWMQRSGLEWFYRLCQEPRRLARRYARGMAVFAPLILGQVLQMRERGGGRPRRTAAAPLASSQTHPAAPAQTPTDPAPVVPQLEGSAAPCPLKAPARLDAAAARELSGPWTEALEQHPVCDIDLSDATFIDSTGLGLLVRLQKRSARLGHRLVLHHPGPQFVATVRTMQIQGYFTFAAPPPPEVPTPPLSGVRGRTAPASGVTSSPCGVSWTGEITAAGLAPLREEACRRIGELADGGTFAIDLAGVTFIDSAGLGLLTGMKRDAWRRHVLLECRNPSVALVTSLQRARLDEYLLGNRESPLRIAG